MMLRIDFEPKHDCAFIKVVPDGITKTNRQLSEEVVVDLDDEGTLIAVDVILHAHATFGLNGPDAQARAQQLVEWARVELASRASSA